MSEGVRVDLRKLVPPVPPRTELGTSANAGFVHAAPGERFYAFANGGEGNYTIMVLDDDELPTRGEPDADGFHPGSMVAHARLNWVKGLLKALNSLPFPEGFR